MLTMEMRLDDERWRGEQEGIKKGLAEGKKAGLAEGKKAGLAEGKLLSDAQTAKNLRKSGWDAAQIAAVLETTPEKVEELLKYPTEK